MRHRSLMAACFVVSVVLAATGFAAETELEGVGSPTLKADLPELVTIWTDGTDFEGVRAEPIVREGLKWATGDILVTDPADNVARPSIASDPSGELFVVVEDQDSQNLQIYRSSDSGNTWTHFRNFGTSPESRNPSMTYTEDLTGERWLMVAYEVATSDAERRVRCYKVDPDLVNPSVFVTIEDGITWLNASEELHPQITSDNVQYSSSYYVYVTYAVPSIDYYPVFFSRSTDRGVNWATPTNITGGSENTGVPTSPEIAYGGSGLYVAFTKPGWDGSGWTSQVWVTQSTDYGSAWSAPLQLTSNSTIGRSNPAVAAAYPDDEVVVAFNAIYSGDTDVSSVASTDGGVNWTAAAPMPYSLDDEGFVDLVASRTSPGRFHAAYLHENDIWYTSASTTDPITWSSAVTVNTGSYASGTTFHPRPSITVNSTLAVADEAAITWSDWRASPLAYEVYFNGPVASGSLFEDDFETNDTSAWDLTVP